MRFKFVAHTIFDANILDSLLMRNLTCRSGFGVMRDTKHARADMRFVL